MAKKKKTTKKAAKRATSKKAAKTPAKQPASTANKVKPSLSWADYEELAYLLIDKFPQTDPKRLGANDLVALASKLPQLDSSEDPNAEQIEHIVNRWHEERLDMEDELGPLEDFSAEPDDLDEDEYRQDKVAEDDEEEESAIIDIDEYEEGGDEEEDDDYEAGY